MRRIGVLVVLALLAGVPALAQAPGPSEEGAAADALPWWGPEEFEDGWTLRVPVVVENDKPHAVTNAPVRVDLDMGNLAQRAGWTTGRVGSEEMLKSFTLEPDSARVVAYSNFRMPRTSPSDASLVAASPGEPGPRQYTVPARVTTGFLQASPTGPYDPSANPILSAAWVADGTLEPGDARHYVVYLEVEEHGSQPGLDDERAYEAMGGQHWISRGHEIYGSGTHAVVRGLEDGTTVSVQTYTGSQPELADIEGENPFKLDAQETRQLFLNAEAVPFRIVVSNPVVATGEAGEGLRRTWDVGFVPSADGTVAGTVFKAPVLSAEYFVIATTTAGAEGRLNGEPFQTEGPATRVKLQDRLRLRVDAPVLVLGELGHRRHQYATPAGAPVGPNVVGSYHGVQYLQSGLVHEEGTMNVYTLQDPVLVEGRTMDDDPRRVIPTSAGSDGLSVDPSEPAFVEGRGSWGYAPLDLEALDPDNPDRSDESARLVAFGGTPNDPFSSPIGGEWARSFVGPTDSHVFGFYNDTHVEAVDGDGDTHVTLLHRGQRLALSGTEVNPFSLETSKPVAVVPTDGVGFGAGRHDSLQAQVGELQYRGHLVSLTPAGDDEEPVVATTTFGEPVRYEFVVENRGRDTDGGSLPDTIQLSHSPVPPGWNVTLSQSEVDLGSGEQSNVTVTVQPPETRRQGTRLKLELSAASEANPDVEVGVHLVTLLRQRREVGLWYEEVDGPQSLTTRLDPGDERLFPLVVQNQGSGPDTLSLTRTEGQLGWTVELRDDGEPVNAVSLEAGEQRRLELSVQSPPRGSLALPTSFSITAASTNDTGARDKALFEGIVVAESSIGLEADRELQHARPGQTVRFDLSLANEGNASADVNLEASLSAPEAWPTPVFLHRGESLAPVDNRLSSVPPTGDDPVALTLEIPVPGEAAGRRSVKVLVTAEASQGSSGSTVLLPLNVFVEPVVEPDVSRPPQIVAMPGASTDWSFEVRNAGNVNATLTLLPSSVPVGWHVEHPALVTFAPNETRAIEGNLTLPPGQPIANETVGFDMELPNGTVEVVTIPFEVPATASLSLEPPESVRLVPGVATTLDVDVVNVGNRPSPASIEIEAPEGWEAQTRAPATALQPEQRTTVGLTLVPARDAGSSRSNVTLRPQDVGTRPDVSPPEPARLEVETRVPDLAVVDASANPLDNEGSTIAVSGTIVNRGDVLVENVTVGLQQGDRGLGETTISQMPPGSPRSAVIQLSEEAPASEGLALVVDPHDRVPETDEDNNLLPVGSTETNPTPGLGAWIALVGLCLGVALRGGPGRRRGD